MTAASLAHNLKGRCHGSYYMALCPSHDDRNPSLSITEKDGKVLVHCHAGCPNDSVIDSLKGRGCWEPSERSGLGYPEDWGELVATYDYTDADGKMLYQACRFVPKSFRPRYPDGRGGWKYRKHPHQVLYHLPEVLEAPIVFVVEGEKDVETLRDWGFVATTVAGGAEAHWLPEYSEALRGREVILIPDNDVAGQKCVLARARALLGVAAKLVVLTLEGAKDVTEWFEAGHSEVELISQVEDEAVTQ